MFHTSAKIAGHKLALGHAVCVIIGQVRLALMPKNSSAP